MILIHQPTFRFEEDEGYETESFVNKPCGGIASSNRPNSDEFLATDFAPLTQFFRPRKIEKIVEARGGGFPRTTDGRTDVLHGIFSSFLPSFLPFSLRKVSREEIQRRSARVDRICMEIAATSSCVLVETARFQSSSKLDRPAIRT